VLRSNNHLIMNVVKEDGRIYIFQKTWFKSQKQEFSLGTETWK